jgi:hypothetical protein
MGTTLARVHHVLLAAPTRLDDRFPWVVFGVPVRGRPGDR